MTSPQKPRIARLVALLRWMLPRHRSLSGSPKGKGATDEQWEIGVADAVLDALGLEQVGWVDSRGWLPSFGNGSYDGPVYRIATPANGRTSTAEGDKQ